MRSIVNNNDTNTAMPLDRLWQAVLTCIFFGLGLISATGQPVGSNRGGRVVNSQQQGIPFATVGLKGGTTLVITDSAGYFRLGEMADSMRLVVSCVGYYDKDFSPAGSFTVVRLMEAPSELASAGIVSSGYQQVSRERSTGSFARIDNPALNRQVGANILQRLDGMASGLQFNIGRTSSNPANKTNISIRGLSTINGPLDPLIVLDGFIYEGDITNINPNDVEDVTLLKDATAASIWGAKAGNGVIVVTTKKGKAGSKPRISVSGTVIAGRKPDLYLLPQMASADLIAIEELAFGRGFFNSTISQPSQPLTPAVEVLLQRRSGLISAADSARLIDALKTTDSRDEYLRYAYRESVTQQYSASVGGGGAHGTYLFSAAYDHSVGDLHNTYRKINLRSQNSYQLAKNLQLSAGLYYTSGEAASGRPAYGSVRVGARQVGYLRLADEEDKPLPVGHIYRQAYTDTAGGGLLLPWGYYPLENYLHERSITDTRELFTTMALQWRISRPLNFDLSYQYQRQDVTTRQHNDEESFSARNMVNLYSQLDRSTGLVRYAVPNGGILTESHSGQGSYTLRGQFNLRHQWGQQDLTAIAGAEIRQARTEMDRYTLYGYKADPLSFVPVDYANTYRTFVTGGFASIPNAPSASAMASRFVSGYANASYTLKGRYTLSASARRDGSNVFGSRTNDRWKPLWSAGASWWLSKEDFYRLSWLPRLRLRATYGLSGNIDPSMTAVAVGSYLASNVAGHPFARIQTLANPVLGWEQSAMLNLAVDFTMGSGWLSGSVEYYRKKGTGLYGPAPYDYTAWGFSRDLVRNVADMAGQGLDLNLNARAGKGLLWEGVLVLGYNTSKTTSYYSSSANDIAAKLGGGTSINPVVGKALYGIAAYRWAGLDSQGNPLGFVNGQPSNDYAAIVSEGTAKGLEGNIVYIGPSNPTVSGTIINTLNWRGLSLSACISYRLGYYFRRPPLSYSALVTNGAGHPDYYRRWQQPGDETHTDVPLLVYPNNSRRDNFYGNAEIHVLRGDHMRLQYVNLSFAPKLKAGSRLEQLQLYVNAANLGILWRANKAGADPDYPFALRPPATLALGLRCGL
jgi:TonB-linked SusC/RagA family outer membrane protein